jgi:hypothetical protein
MIFARRANSQTFCAKIHEGVNRDLGWTEKAGFRTVRLESCHSVLYDSDEYFLNHTGCPDPGDLS